MENQDYKKYYEEQRKENPFYPYELQIATEDRKKIIAKSLHDFRVLKGYTQKQVCDLIKIAPQTYNGYEKGRNEAPAEILVRLSFLYDVPVDMLIGRDVFFIDDESAALKQLDDYNKQLELIRKELSNSEMGGNPEILKLFDNLNDFTKALTEKVKDGILTK